jgi:hypothetical protein
MDPPSQERRGGDVIDEQIEIRTVDAAREL